MVTHILRQARRLADYVIFLYLGNLIEHDPAQEFFNNPKYTKTQSYINGKFIEEHKIDRIYSLRNNLVHDGAYNISQYDRNLLKIYVEVFIEFFIFQLRVGAPIYKSSHEFGLKRRDNKNDDQRHVEYDEIKGLFWEDIYMRQKLCWANVKCS